MPSALQERGPARPPADQWLLLVLALGVGLAGLALAAGGVLLLTLGGSAYYLIAGVVLLVCAALLIRRSPLALVLYALLVLGTVAWAVYEIGLDWWQLVPRGDVMFVLGVLLCLPWIARPLVRPAPVSRRAAVLALAASLVVAAVVGVAALATPDGKQWDHGLAMHDAPPPAWLAAQDGDWPAYGGTWQGNRFSPLAQITAGNVRRLERIWTFHTGDHPRPGDPNEFTNEVTPIKVGNTLYTCTPHDIVYALDPETGQVRWKYDPHIRVSPNLQHLTCRGVSYARVAGADCPERIFLATNDARLIALDPRTGRLCGSFGNAGQLDLWAGMPHLQNGWYQITSAPLVTRGKVVLAGAIYDNAAVTMPSGVIRAFDAATGRLVWNFDPGNPTHTAPIAPGQSYVASTPNSWSTASADDQLGLIYLPMGNGAVDQWGGNRSPETERYTATILALDADTGKERWHFQTVHHDLWDMDVPAQPALVDLDIPGKGRVPALVQSTKTGNIFVLDRRTGEPLFPVTEHPVPGGPAPGDHLSPTQPFSAATFFPREIRERDMWGVTPFDQLACRIRFRHLRYDGPFTPPSLQGSIVFPGNFGVMDWGGIAVDPIHQVAFAHPNYMAFVDKLVPQARVRRETKGPAGGSDLSGQEQGLNPNLGAPFAVLLNPFLSEIGLPCQAPPWGYVAAMDLTTGRIAWRRINGTIRDESPVPLPIKMGVPSLGGPLVTRGGVAFLGSTLDYYLRAYDMRSGKTLWSGRLPAGAQASPMSYWSAASGRQFVVVMSGGHRSLGTELGDELVAYALPRK